MEQVSTKSCTRKTKSKFLNSDYYPSGCLLDYDYFKNYYKMIAVDLSKQKTIDADPKAIQQINFPGKINKADNVFHY